MSHYWAKFKKIEGRVFRFDTRIYLHDVKSPKADDICVGAVVGKNPGSAKASIASDKLQAIELDGDKLLPTVRNIVLKAYREADAEIPENGYIQVMNLFYLCNPKLGDAIRSIDKVSDDGECLSEKRAFPWVWYVWGGEVSSLSPFKNRFNELNTKNHFFYNKIREEVSLYPATSVDFAKHTQGLKHAYVVPHISNLVKKWQVLCGN